SDISSVAIVPINWSVFGQGSVPPFLKNLASSFLCDQIVGKAEMEFTPASFAGLSPSVRIEYALSYLLRTVAGVVGLPDGAIEPAQGLAELGIDSLMALELKNRLEQELEAEVTMAQLLANPSIRDLAQIVSDSIVAANAFNSKDELG